MSQDKDVVTPEKSGSPLDVPLKITKEKKIPVAEKKTEYLLGTGLGAIPPHLTPAVSNSVTSEATPSSAAVTDMKSAAPSVEQFQMLGIVLHSIYQRMGYVNLPLSERRFPMQAVSLAVSDKSTQDSKSLDKKTEDKKRQKEEFWSPQSRVEEQWHRINPPIAVQDLFVVEGGTDQAPTQRILVEGPAGMGKTTRVGGGRSSIKCQKQYAHLVNSGWL